MLIKGIGWFDGLHINQFNVNTGGKLFSGYYDGLAVQLYFAFFAISFVPLMQITDDAYNRHGGPTAWGYKPLLLPDGSTYVPAGSAFPGDRLTFVYSSIAGGGTGGWILEDKLKITDALLREKSLGIDIELELAIGGNLTRSMDQSGKILSSIFDEHLTQVGFPAENAINGKRTHIDYDTDIPNNYWMGSYDDGWTTDPTKGTWFTIDLGRSANFNEIVFYQHPLVGFMDPAVGYKFRQVPSMQYMIYASNSPPTPGVMPDQVSPWTLISEVQIAVDDPDVYKQVVRFPTVQTYRYVSFFVGGASFSALSDGNKPNAKDSPACCQVEFYNFSDESSRVIWPENGQPSIRIEKSISQQQTAVPTPSDFQFSLQNNDARYSPGNVSSPLYGTTQFDGIGDGIRAGGKVRFYFLVTGADGIQRGKRTFDGFIYNPQSNGSPQAVQTSESTQEAIFVCKGLASLLSTKIYSRAYQGEFFKEIVYDQLGRVNIARQDIQIDNIWQAVPYAFFDQSSPQDALQEMAKALPFMRIVENHDPSGIIITNKGRTRADIDFSIFGNGVNTLADVRTIALAHDGVSPYHFFWRGAANAWSPNPSRIYRWDDRTSVADCVDVGAGDKWSLWRDIFNGKIYEIFYNLGDEGNILTQYPKFRTIDTTTGAFTITNLGGMPIGSGPIRYGPLVYAGAFLGGAVRFGNFLYVGFEYYGAAGQALYVWDMTGPISMAVYKAQIGTVQDVPPTFFAADTNHFMYANSASNVKDFGSDPVVYVWAHLGFPLTFTATFTPRNFFSFGSIGPDGAKYNGRVKFFLADDGYLYGLAQPTKNNGLVRYELWRVPMSTFATGAATASLLGVVADNVGSEIEDLVVSNGIAYVLDRTSLWAWNVSKDVSTKFDLGTAFQHTPYQSAFQSGPPDYIPWLEGVRTHASFAHQGCHDPKPEMGNLYPDVNPSYIDPTLHMFYARNVDCCSSTPAIDSKGRLWVLLGESAGPLSSEIRIFSISKDQFTQSPANSFSDLDGFVTTMTPAYGSPTANEVNLDSNPYQLVPHVDNLWAQQEGIVFPAGVKTTVKIPLNNTSPRGYGNSTTTRRYLSIPVTVKATTVPLPQFNVPFNSSFADPPWNPGGLTQDNFGTGLAGWNSSINHVTFAPLGANGFLNGLEGGPGRSMLIDVLVPSGGAGSVTIAPNAPSSLAANQFRISGPISLTRGTSSIFYWLPTPTPGWYPNNVSNASSNNIFDDPSTTTMALIEGVLRPVNFWALGNIAYLTVDNSAKPACLLSGMNINGFAISSRISKSAIVQAIDQPSIDLYKTQIPVDISSQFVNDPTEVRDLLLVGKQTRIFVDMLLPLYPILDPAKQVGVSESQEGISNMSSEVVKVVIQGLETTILSSQVIPGYTI